MPAVTLNRQWFGASLDGTPWSRSFDAVEIEDHVFETTVCDNPVETGGSIADHAYDLPVKLTLTAAVSDLPPKGKESDLYANEGPSRSLAAYAWLRNVQRAHEPFSVQTGLDLYPSMLISSLKVKLDKDHTRILYFTVSLSEIIIVSTQVVYYPTKPKTKRALAAKKDDGEKDSEEPTSAERKKTFLKILKGLVFK